MDVTTYSLQMSEPAATPPRPLPEDARLDRATAVTPEYARFLYAIVGGDWNWNDRLGWTRQQWAEELAMPGSEFWVLYRGGTPQGYAQLRCTPGTNVEILYFGLAATAIGQGLGGPLLEQVIAAAWTIADRHDLPPASRVWLHTCTLDGPAALDNYQRRGFKIFKTETADVRVPSRPHGAWLAAGGPG